MSQLLHALATGPLTTEYGDFEVTVLYDGLEECIVLHRGLLRDAEGAYCRLHSQCFTGHVFHSTECDCDQQMRSAQESISRLGVGLILLLHQEGKANGAAAHIASQSLKRTGLSQPAAYLALGFPADARDYAIATKVLRYFGPRSVRMYTEDAQKLTAVRSAGVSVEQHAARTQADA
jgi:GTP cyclohydrolase II